MKENGLTRLEREKKVQQKRLLMILALLVTFFGGFVMGTVVGTRGPSKPSEEEPLPQVVGEQATPMAPAANETAKEELPLTFYQRLQEPPEEVPLKAVPEKTPEVLSPEAPQTPPQKAKETPSPKPPQAPPQILSLQVGSFKDIKRAQGLAEELEAEGLTSEVKEVKVKGTTWYRVLVKAKDRGEVERIIRTLEAKGLKPVKVPKED